MRRRFGLVAAFVLLAAQAGAMPMSVSFTAAAYIPGNDGVSFANGYGSVQFDPATFVNPDGNGGGEGAATGATIALTGLSRYGLAVDTTTFSLPGVPIDVVWSVTGCGCSAFLPMITFGSSTPGLMGGPAPVDGANADGLYLAAISYGVFALLDQNPGAAFGVQPLVVPFKTTVVEPGSLALLATFLAGGASVHCRRSATP